MDELPRRNQQEGTFRSRSAAIAGDERRVATIRSEAARRSAERRAQIEALPDGEAMRELAGRIRQNTLDHLDYYLGQFKANAEQRGAWVHFATDAAEANQTILGIVEAEKCERIAGCNSIISEEIGLWPALREAGRTIVRAKGVPGVDPTEDGLAGEERQGVDMALTGADFLIAETGQVCVVGDGAGGEEGGVEARVLVTVAGIESVTPRMADLAVLLKLLARSMYGRPMGTFAHFFGGGRPSDATDGPESHHVVVVDNGRTGILAGGYRDVMRCIHCRACEDACPVYRHVGGSAYGDRFSGPIGAVMAPLLEKGGSFRDLPWASTLCGACFEACPVKINLPVHLRQLRCEQVAAKERSSGERLRFRFWGWAFRKPLLRRILRRSPDQLA